MAVFLSNDWIVCTKTLLKEGPELVCDELVVCVLLDLPVAYQVFWLITISCVNSYVIKIFQKRLVCDLSWMDLTQMKRTCFCQESFFVDCLLADVPEKELFASIEPR